MVNFPLLTSVSTLDRYYGIACYESNDKMNMYCIENLIAEYRFSMVNSFDTYWVLKTLRDISCEFHICLIYLLLLYELFHDYKSICIVHQSPFHLVIESIHPGQCGHLLVEIILC